MMMQSKYFFLGVCLVSCAPSLSGRTPMASSEGGSPSPAIQQMTEDTTSLAEKGSEASDLPGRSTASAGSPKVLVQPMPRMPKAVTSFGAAAWGESMYVLGGYFGKPHDYSREGQSGSFFAYDLKSEQWRNLPPIEALQSVTLTTVGNTLVRAGGMRAKNAKNEATNMHSVAEVAQYFPKEKRWNNLVPLPDPRSSHDAGAQGDRLFVVGGWNMSSEGKSRTWHDTSLVLDLSATSPKWREISQPFKRRALAVAVGAKYLYAIGGINKDGTSPRVDILDLQTETWRRGPDLPSDGFGAAAIVLDDASVLVSVRSGKVYRLSSGGSTWQDYDHLLFPRFFHRFVAAGKRIWALGGINGMTADDRIVHVEAVDGFPNDEPNPIARAYHWSIKWPGIAKNRQAVYLERDSLYLFGGNNSLEQHDFAESNFVQEGWALHLTSLRHEAQAPLPSARQSMVAVKGINEQVQLLGGFGWDGKVARTHDEGFLYDPQANAWLRQSGALSIPLSQFHVMRDHDRKRMLTMGGLDYHPGRSKKDQFRHNTAILASDKGQKFVDSGMSTPPRRAFASAQIGDRFYVVGGMKDGFKSVDNCGYLSVSDPQSWKSITCPKQYGLGARLVHVDGQLVLMRGRIAVRTNETLAAAIAIYDKKNDRWVDVLSNIPIPNTHVHALAHRKDLMLFSTHFAEAKADIVLIKLPRINPLPENSSAVKSGV